MKKQLIALTAAACLAVTAIPSPLFQSISVFAEEEPLLTGIDTATAELLGCQVSLGSGIGLHYGIHFGDSVTSAQLQSAYMEFTVGSEGTIQKCLFSEAELNSVNGQECYLFKCELAARQMADTVQAVLHMDGVTQTAPYVFSVKQYADEAVKRNNFPPSAKNAIRSMLDYGTASQIYFDYNTSNAANADTFGTLPTSVPKAEFVSKGTVPNGLSYIGSSLLLKSKLAIRHYFEVKDGFDVTDFTFTIDGVTVTPIMKNDYYYIEVTGVMPTNFDKPNTIAVTDGTNTYSYEFSAMTYCYLTMQGNPDTKLKNAVLSLCGYAEETCDYQEYASYTRTDYNGLVINEICGSNASGIQTKKGKYPDWIELYNGTNKDLPIAGLGLSDGNSNKFKFTFSNEDEILKSGEYVVVFCDEKPDDQEGEYHADFKISADGETLCLTHPLLGELDKVEMPAIDTDITYARKSDGSFDFMNPTPNAQNIPSSSPVMTKAPAFSAESGFYADAFQLEISQSDGAAIYYTLDGSDPQTSATRKRYSTSIAVTSRENDANHLSAITNITLEGVTAPNENVDKAVVIKAVAEKDGISSQVVTNTYFVNKTDDFYQNMKVVSLVTDEDYFFDDEIGIYVVGSSYENNPKLDTYSTQNSTNYNGGKNDLDDPFLTAHPEGKEWERPCTMQIFENGELKYSDDVGVQISGNATRSYEQKSLNICARKYYGKSDIEYKGLFNKDDGNGNTIKLLDVNGEKINKFSKLTLRNGGNDFGDARIRDDIIHDMATGLNIGTLAKADTVVFLNGEFWGYYSLQEKADKDYIASHYDVKSGNVTALKAPGDHTVVLDDGDASIKAEYDEFTKWACSSDLTTDENYQKVCDTIDIDSFIDYVSLETYICNYDWINELGINNFYAWRATEPVADNPYADGKWRFVIYDTEFSTAMYSDGRTSYKKEAFSALNDCTTEGNIGALFLKLMENKTFAEKFAERFKEIANDYFSAEIANQKIENRIAAISDAMEKTQQRFTGAHFYTDSVAEFFNKRGEYAMKYLGYLLDPASYPTNVELATHAPGQSYTAECPTTVPEHPYECQAVADWDIYLQKGYTYEFTYKVTGPAGGKFAGYVMRGGGDYKSFIPEADEIVTTNGSEIKKTITFTMKESCYNARISFDCGYATGKYTFTDISLKCTKNG